MSKLLNKPEKKKDKNVPTSRSDLDTSNPIRTYLGIDEEYEEISSIESPNPFDNRNSVHFIINETHVSNNDLSMENNETNQNTANIIQRENVDETQNRLVDVIHLQRNDDVNYSVFNEVTESEIVLPTIEDAENKEDENEITCRHSVTTLPTIEVSDVNEINEDSTETVEIPIDSDIVEHLEHDPDSEIYSPTFEEDSGGLSEITRNDKRASLFFRDGKRRIDLVLVYEEDEFLPGVLDQCDHQKLDFRTHFQNCLEAEGLELEIEPKEVSFDKKTCFVKINCPYKVLLKHAAILNIQPPVKGLASVSVNAWEGKDEENSSYEEQSLCNPILNMFRINSHLVEDDSTLFRVAFSGNDAEDKLILKERVRFFTSAQRTQIVWQICLRARFGEDNHIGIRKLLKNHTYTAAFPLHEGNHNEDSDCGFSYDRRILYLVWARAAMWYKNQPLWLIRKYFGDKIALYFAWLGFYTKMLILPSIVGLICFIYGLSTMDSFENTPSHEICNPDVSGDITLCPLCDNFCSYQKLKDSCLFSNVTYLFDNTSTVFFAIFMSFWATSFLELWKRKQALISWQWDLHAGIEDEDTRPEFDSSAKIFQINPVTRRKEPIISPTERALNICISILVVTFMILVVFFALFIVIVFRLYMFTVVVDSHWHLLKTHAKLITSITAAILNLIIIVVLNKIYHYVAHWLTNRENPRTHTQFEKSFTIKIFIFEFTNYYLSLIYIAFFKGRFFTHPGDVESRNSLWLRLRGDVCDPAGCLSELCIQLAIIMIGKQTISNVLELLFPAIRNWWRNRTINKHKAEKEKELSNCEENYALQDPGDLALFEEYLEMVVQYGFVTLFVAAFPLAPLFALLNNICEIRLDAYKMTAQSRRPIHERVENIGAWSSVLRVITYLSVLSNGFVIAFTSDYIPRKVYQLFYSPNGTLVGYIDSSLSAFNTSELGFAMDRYRKEFGTDPPDTCQYRGYRNGPDHDEPYSLSIQYWIIYGARLLFVICFEHIVVMVTVFMASFIPNVPSQVSRQIHLEKQLLKENRHPMYTDNKKTKKELDAYDQFLWEVRRTQKYDSRKLGEVVNRNTWVRRVSRRISNNSIISKFKRHSSSENEE